MVQEKYHTTFLGFLMRKESNCLGEFHRQMSVSTCTYVLGLYIGSINYAENIFCRFFYADYIPLIGKVGND